MTITHLQLCQATDETLEIEGTHQHDPAQPNKRYDWLTESELTARLRTALVNKAKVAPDWLKVNAQGNRAPGRSSANLEEGMPLASAIEVSYCWAQAAPSPAKPVDDDLNWLLAAPGRHVVVYFPPMREGYGIQKHATPYSPSGVPIGHSTNRFLASECLQVGGLGDASLSLFAGVIDQVNVPVAGRTARWSLSPSLKATARITARGSIIERQLIGTPSASLWAVVWTHA